MRASIVNLAIKTRLKSGLVFGSLILVLSLNARASTINIPADQPTIQAGIDAASNGDTILVSPGTYFENIDYSGKSIVITTTGGSPSTTLRPADIDSNLIDINKGEGIGTEISGFTIAYGQSGTINIDNGSNVFITNNVFHTGGNSEIAVIRVDDPSSIALVVSNLFYENQSISCVGLEDGSATLIGNTLDNNTKGVYRIRGTLTLINNIISNSAHYGIFGEVQGSHNNLFFNGYNSGAYSDYSFGAEPMDGDISADPLFADVSANDYSLHPTSLCIDAASPDLQYINDDGTRGDIGVLPFIQALPAPLYLSIPGYLPQISDHTPQYSWTFSDTTGSQAAYEIQVGTDDDWSVAEMWATGEISSSDEFAVYAGLTLIDGITYYYRTRLNNGSEWGGWVEGLPFTLNNHPTAPSPISPVSSAVVSTAYLDLTIIRGTDIENIWLKYDYEIYEDAGLTMLAESVAAIWTSYRTSTLEPDKQYWWRARSFDDYDYSEWSSVATFVTRAPLAIKVPLDQSTIQGAVDAAENGDTVLVSAGTYPENITIDSKALIIAGAGSDVTTISQPLGSSEPIINVSTSARTQLEIEFTGFTVSGATTTPLAFNRYFANIHDNVFRDNPLSGSSEEAVIFLDGSKYVSCLISNNVFSNNGGAACVSISGGTYEIANNTFDGNNTALLSPNPYFGLFMNNIITNSIAIGVIADTSLLDYNNLYNNYSDFSDGLYVGSNNVFDNPRFVDAANGDYRLYGNSPNVNAGNPDPQYKDFDGSRNDIGAFALDCGADTDCDYVSGADNCPTTFNPEQIDSDNDGAGDACDECTLVPGACTPCCSASGDADNGGDTNVGDATFIVRYIFQDGEAPACLDQADADGGGDVNIGDAIYIVKFIFQDGLTPVCGSTGL